MDLQENKATMIKVTIWGSIINLLLGAAKVVIGFMFHSQALIMDGIHSFSDLFTDVFVLIIAKYSQDHADEEHPYGHGRFETLGTVAIGIILIFVAMFLAIDNYQIFESDVAIQRPEWPTIVVALLSILANEWIYRFTLKAGNQIKSQLLIANAWHSRSDAFSSILVFVGLLASIAGLEHIDLIMAIILSFFIGKVGWDFIAKSLKELVDTSLDKEERNKIKIVIQSVDGVKGYHNLRSRKLGDRAILDVNIEVSPHISVSEGHEISTCVAEKIMSTFDYIYDVTVHTDVEDDREEGVDYIIYDRSVLPLRTEVLHMIKGCLGHEDYNKIKDIKIHYASQKIDLDFYYEKASDVAKQRVEEKLSEVDLFRTISFFQML